MSSQGSNCPHCNRETLREKLSYRRCSNCNYVAWTLQHEAVDLESAPASTCPHCEWLTLVELVKMRHGESVRRCSTCNYVAIEPAMFLDSATDS